MGSANNRTEGIKRKLELVPSTADLRIDLPIYERKIRSLLWCASSIVMQSQGVPWIWLPSVGGTAPKKLQCTMDECLRRKREHCAKP